MSSTIQNSTLAPRLGFIPSSEHASDVPRATQYPCALLREATKDLKAGPLYYLLTVCISLTHNLINLLTFFNTF